jgi:hypothetical protein
MAVGGVQLLEAADSPEVHRQLTLMFDSTHPAAARKRGQWDLGLPRLEDRRRLDVRRGEKDLKSRATLVLRSGNRAAAVVGVEQELSTTALAIIRNARRLGHMVAVTGEDLGLVDRAGADLLVSGGHGLPGAIKSQDGCVVTLIAQGGSQSMAALVAADVGLEVLPPMARPGRRHHPQSRRRRRVRRRCHRQRPGGQPPARRPRARRVWPGCIVRPRGIARRGAVEGLQRRRRRRARRHRRRHAGRGAPESEGRSHTRRDHQVARAAGVLCTDKTGTLTEGRIRLRRVSDGVDDVGLRDLPERHAKVIAAGRRASPEPNGDVELPDLTDRAIVAGAAALHRGDGVG